MTSDDRTTIKWRRLDVRGHETATLVREPDGWRLSGVSVLSDGDWPYRLEYEIECDPHWLTRRCVFRGCVSTTLVALDIARTAHGEWAVGGVPDESLNGCDDIDLGFTPATNLLPIRRLGLGVGAKADVRAAWVGFPEFTIEVLEQSYTRLAEDRYLYESGGGAFRRELRVDDVGFVVEYPDFWRAEART